jgi:hypothetical protein
LVPDTDYKQQIKCRIYQHNVADKNGNLIPSPEAGIERSKERVRTRIGVVTIWISF